MLLFFYFHLFLSLLEILLVLGKGTQAAPTSCRGCHKLSLLLVGIDARSTALGEARKALSLGQNLRSTK